MPRMNTAAEARAAGAVHAARRLLHDTHNLQVAWEQLAMRLVQELQPSELAGALAAAALDQVIDQAAADEAMGVPAPLWGRLLTAFRASVAQGYRWDRGDVARTLHDIDAAAARAGADQPPHQPRS